MHALVYFGEFHHGSVNYCFPTVQTILVASLQFDHLTLCILFKLFITVKLFLAVFVLLHQLSHGRDCTQHFGFESFDVGNQHAKLRAPVPDVVGPHHLVPFQFQDATNAIPNNS